MQEVCENLGAIFSIYISIKGAPVLSKFVRLR